MDRKMFPKLVTNDEYLALARRWGNALVGDVYKFVDKEGNHATKAEYLPAKPKKKSESESEAAEDLMEDDPVDYDSSISTSTKSTDSSDGSDDSGPDLKKSKSKTAASPSGAKLQADLEAAAAE